jgi:hypothetical protein
MCLTDDPTVVVSAAFREVRQRFEDSVAQSKAVCAQQLTELQKQASVVQNLVDESELLLTSDDYRTSSKIQAFLERLVSEIETLQSAPIPVSPAPIQNELLPPFETLTVEIDDFPRMVERFRGLSSDEPRFIYSEKRKLCGGIWRVKIYPCGNANGLGSFVSVFLELIKGVKDPVEYVYRFAVFHGKDPSKSVIRDYCSQYRELDSWGWNKAIALSDVLGDPDFLSGERSTLRFELSLRPESYKVLYDLTASSYEAMKAKSAAMRAILEAE